jgi:DNA recombination protein RmuC
MNLTEIILIFTIALILGLFWQINQLKENRAQEDQIVHLKENLQELRTRIDLLIDANRLSGVDLKNDLNRDLATLRTTLVEQLEASGRGVRETLTQRLAEIQLDTSNKLEQMRQTVDEKLHATLEQRLGESFKQVSDRLEQVHRGLGEMQTLATGVGDLKRVLTNVKSRGTWGEVQLGALIEQTLTIEQYSKNIATRPNSRDIVEFAIRLPGQEAVSYTHLRAHET